MKAALVPRNIDALGENRIFEFDGYDPLQQYGADRIGFHRLRERFEAQGDELVTADQVTLDAVDVCLFVDVRMDYLHEALSLTDPPALAYVMREPPSVVPTNAASRLVRFASVFDRVFTWNPELADAADRFVEYNIPQYLDPEPLDRPPFADRTLLSNVTSRKYSRHPEELYSAREEVIRWYDERHPDRFSLFGRNWGDHQGLRDYYSGQLEAPDYRTYEGLAETKADVYGDHRFALCYENMTGISGYLTEKLFDCFRAGTVPVYWGAVDVDRYVPDDAYLDYREFGSPAALHERLAGMGESEHRGYVEAAREFLSTADGTLGPDQYAETIHEGVSGLSRSAGPVPTPLRNRIAAHGRAERLSREREAHSFPKRLLTLGRAIASRPQLLRENPSVVARALRGRYG